MTRTVNYFNKITRVRPISIGLHNKYGDTMPVYPFLQDPDIFAVGYLL
jgi:hypothetical protein